jgi:hypothetical protein
MGKDFIEAIALKNILNYCLKMNPKKEIVSGVGKNFPKILQAQ